jgi:simple sugar transport system substrate-binding protein
MNPLTLHTVTAATGLPPRKEGTMKSVGKRRSVRLLAVTAALAVGLVGCSSTGGKKANEPAAGSGGSGGQVANTKRFTIAMVTHETPGDTFWDKIRAGAQAAAAKDNINLKYSNDPDAGKQAGLIQNAVDSKVDAIATTLVTPEALAPAVKAAEKAKIPVVGFNSGIGQWKQLGALMYFGSDETLAGTTAGKRITDAGGKKPLCVIQAAGSVALEARCAGLKKTAPNTENIDVNGADLASVRSTIAAKLQQDKSIDYVVTLGAPIALTALESKADAGSKAKVVTFDLNAEAAKAIQSGKITFSIDQQPYLQGYEAVDSLWLYLTNRNELGGGLPVLTGPSFVDQSNIAAIAQYAAKNTR